MALSTDWRLVGWTCALLGVLAVVALVALGAVAVPLSVLAATEGLVDLATYALAVGLGGALAATRLLTPRRVLARLDAAPAPDDAHRGVRATLRRLSTGADVPPPRLWIAPVDEPTALTVGLGRPVVCLTTGLLEVLDEREREAVLAHEVAHVANRDAAVLSVAAAPAAATRGIGTVALAGAVALVVATWLALALALALAVVGVGADLAVAAALVPVVALAVGAFVVPLGIAAVPLRATTDAFSRAREFAADRGAAILTGDPAALASALRTLEDGRRATPERDLRSVDGVAAFCIVADEGATHPTVEARIERLARYERELAVDG